MVLSFTSLRYSNLVKLIRIADISSRQLQQYQSSFPLGQLICLVSEVSAFPADSSAVLWIILLPAFTLQLGIQHSL